MPTINANGIEIYYETTGDPNLPPLLLITGLTGTLADWWPQVPALAGDYFVITMDNRGGGKSSYPPPGYTMADMTDDVASLMAALQLETVFLFGISMGGMIAQNFALRHSHRVRRLALGCTQMGGSHIVLPEPEVLQSIINPQTSGDPRQDILQSATYLMAEGYLEKNPHVFDLWVDLAANNPQTEEAYMGQLQAIASHDVYDRLGALEIPTLVLHGAEDKLIPVENGRLLAARIPGAKLIIISDCGHMFFWEKAEEVNGLLRQFFCP